MGLKERRERRWTDEIRELQIWLEDIKRRALKEEDKKMSFLVGYKTYICAALYVLAVMGEAFGVIDKATAETLKGVTFGGGLAALRAGVSK